jgi:RHS repeat-associated protein
LGLPASGLSQAFPRPSADRPLAEINNDGSIRFFYHQDWLGNVALLTDAAGAKLQTYTFDVWGEPSGFDASGSPIAASAFESRFLFTAREYDVETALYHYRARTYSPQLGRFAQFDPIDFAAGDTNLLRYADNQPTFLIDPLGMTGEEVCDEEVHPTDPIEKIKRQIKLLIDK